MTDANTHYTNVHHDDIVRRHQPIEDRAKLVDEEAKRIAADPKQVIEYLQDYPEQLAPLFASLFETVENYKAYIDTGWDVTERGLKIHAAILSWARSRAEDKIPQPDFDDAVEKIDDEE